MDHRIKASIQWILSAAPGGIQLNNRLQAVRKMMPDWFLKNKLGVAREVFDLYSKFADGNLPSEQIRSLEIGAGWDLLLPLAMRGCGGGAIQCIDIFDHLDERRIGEAVGLLRMLDLEHCARKLPPWPSSSRRELATLLKTAYGIQYSAPCDARATNFESDSFDLFLSYHVMEHIPAVDLRSIHVESFRILRPGGVAIHYVDLQDHWAYATRRRSVHGFLANGSLAWKYLNPPIHYQNRIRSKEHLDSLRSAGFQIAFQKEVKATDEQIASLSKPGAIDSSFLGKGSIEELGVTYLMVVGKKPG